MKSSRGPQADIGRKAPRLTAADLIQHRKAPLTESRDRSQWGESIDLKSTFICCVMSHASVIKV